VSITAFVHNWEAKLKIHPVHTHFESNGTYYSEYFNLKDSLVKKGIVSPEKEKKKQRRSNKPVDTEEVGHLKDHVEAKMSEENGWPVLQIWFRDYGRLVEIQANQKKTVFSRMTSTEHALYGINRGKKKKKA